MLSEYINAGYVPVIGCQPEQALEWVHAETGMNTRFNKEAIEVNLMTGIPDGTLWADSGWYYEGGYLWKSEKK